MPSAHSEEYARAGSYRGCSSKRQRDRVISEGAVAPPLHFLTEISDVEVIVMTGLRHERRPSFRILIVCRNFATAKTALRWYLVPTLIDGWQGV